MICYMSESASSPGRRSPPPRGVTMSDVERAADACLREGRRPTIEKVRARLGTGSPNTINPLLDAWWKRLGRRLGAKVPADDQPQFPARSLEAQIQELDLLIRKEQAARVAQAERIAALEKELKAQRRTSTAPVRSKAPAKPKAPRRSKRAAPRARKSRAATTQRKPR